MKLIAWLLRNTYFRYNFVVIPTKVELKLLNVYQLNKHKGLEVIYLGKGKFGLL